MSVALGVLAASLVLLLASLISDGDDAEPSNATAATAATTASTAPTETSPETRDGTDLEVAGIDFGTLDLPPGEPYTDYSQLVDDTDTIQVEVPASWSEIDTRPTPNLGSPLIAASSEFLRDDQPEVYVGYAPRDGTVEEALRQGAESLTLELDCSGVATFDYDDGFYTGLADLWTGCSELDVVWLLIRTGNGFAVDVKLVTSADIDAAIRVIETFSFTGE